MACEVFIKGEQFEGVPTFFDGHRIGAQAAWDLGVKTERERIRKHWDIIRFNVDTSLDALTDCIDPPALKQKPAEEGEDE